jgi:hypothetical protein
MIDSLQYVVDELATNWDDRDWWHQRLEARVAGPVLAAIHGTDGVDVMAEDWDNLLVLDAARADTFESVLDLDQFDDYETVTSVGSSSPEWMEKTFAGREFSDTVYVSGNPWISKIAPDSFHRVYNLWTAEHDVSEDELAEVDILEELDVETETVLAGELTDAAIDAHERHPNKRIVVHYFQPHAPCVGLPDGTVKSDVNEEVHPGTPLKNGVVERSEVVAAYEDNLAYAFHHADRFASTVGGRSVFTADHAELFGEWCWPLPIRGYAHPSGLRHPDLTTVPWAGKTIGSRRRIKRGSIEHHEADEAELDRHLEDLGYRV